MKHYDIAIAGFGPAGATAACMLGQLGYSVLVVDRLTGVYDKPRAFAMDHEILRVYQNLGVAEAMLPHIAPFLASEHYGVEGQLIRRLTMVDPPYPMGWTPSVVFLQPPIEEALRARVREIASVELVLGCEFVSLAQDEAGVTIDLRDAAGAPQQARAKYLIGCDGASSTVRRQIGVVHDDLGFDEPWLVVDVLVNEGAGARLPKTNAQFCEPARPTTYLIGTGQHRRWEIMLLPGEDPKAMEADQATWQLLSRWLSPDEGRLWRQASYRFHALVASRWRVGRVFLAGDAAHQQPPFLGQGMCQGVRDVANLTWKLDAVLKGRAGDGLLDTYGAERSSHVRRLTTTIKHIGHNICERDPVKARQRDADLIAQAGGVVKSVPRQDLIPPLDCGLLAQPAHAANGTLFPQPAVTCGGNGGLLDDIAGAGLRLVLSEGVSADEIAALASVRDSGARVIRVGGLAGAAGVATGTQIVAEADGIVAAWFARHRACAALVRPDHYVYGVAADSPGIDRLVAGFNHSMRGLSQVSSTSRT
jgi:3-(3-hydroxy-phenyl)propionate hydroxylase